MLLPRMKKNWWMVVLTTLPYLTNAQSIGLWTGIDFEKKLNSAFSVNLGGETRFTDNVSTLKTYLGEAGLEYKLSKRWGVSVFYRYINRRKLDKSTDEYEYRPYHRFYGNITYDYKLTKWLKFDYRLRYQNQFKDDESGLINNGSYIRNKFELSYRNKSKLTPGVSADVFYLLGTGFDQIRLKAAISYSLNKHNSLNLSVFTDYPLLEDIANNAIVSVSYKLKW